MIRYQGVDLYNYYKQLFILQQYRKFSLTELFSLYPWELEVFSLLIMEDDQEKEQREKNQQMNNMQF